jgi:hypothetical protein
MRKWFFPIVAVAALTVTATWTPQVSAQRIAIGIGTGGWGYGPAMTSYGSGYYPGYNYAPAYSYAPAYNYGYSAYSYPAYSYGYSGYSYPAYSSGYSYGYNYGYAPRGVGVVVGPRGGVGVGYYGPNVSFGYTNINRGYYGGGYRNWNGGVNRIGRWR